MVAADDEDDELSPFGVAVTHHDDQLVRKRFDWLCQFMTPFHLEWR
jgi:hypothetical protein